MKDGCLSGQLPDDLSRLQVRWRTWLEQAGHFARRDQVPEAVERAATVVREMGEMETRRPELAESRTWQRWQVRAQRELQRYRGLESDWRARLDARRRLFIARELLQMHRPLGWAPEPSELEETLHHDPQLRREVTRRMVAEDTTQTGGRVLPAESGSSGEEHHPVRDLWWRFESLWRHGRRGVPA